MPVTVCTKPLGFDADCNGRADNKARRARRRASDATFVLPKLAAGNDGVQVELHTAGVGGLRRGHHHDGGGDLLGLGVALVERGGGEELHEPHGGEDVEGVGLQNLLGLVVGDGARGALVAGVGDDDVERAEMGLGVLCLKGIDTALHHTGRSRAPPWKIWRECGEGERGPLRKCAWERVAFERPV